MKKMCYKILILLVTTVFFLTDTLTVSEKSNSIIKRSTKVARFDFMCAIEAGNVNAVTQCLEQGLDVNERWGEGQDTPLMFAIKKLASEKENQENLTWNALYTLYSSAGLAGLVYLGLWSSSRIINYGKAFKANWLETVKSRWKESVIYPVACITAAGAGIFFSTSLIINAKKIIEYLYYRWKTSTSRLMIIEQLIKHPSIDLSLRNEIKKGDGMGQTALDVVQELQKKGQNSGYINDLLRTVEMAIKIKEKMNQVPVEKQ